MRLALEGLAVSAAALLVACGGGAQSAPTATSAATTAPDTATRPAQTSTVVLAATATAVSATPAPAPPSPTPPAAAPSSTETPPPPPPPPTEPAPVGVTLTVVARNVLFVTKSLSAAAGPITIVFDNQDASVAHNIHFFSNAVSIGMTDLMTGPATETLSLGTLAPGAYSYKCDVHPTTMTGVLTVS
jgi:plastocyanin